MAVQGGMTAICIAVTAISSVVAPGPPVEHVLSFYGTEGDGYLGQHHSAFWHDLDCGLPDVVDGVHFGAAGPRWVPLCSRHRVCYGERCITVTVVDRQRDDLIYGRPHFDLWPAAAQQLGFVGEGIVVGTVSGLEVIP